jgi:hypothetical protein
MYRKTQNKLTGGRDNKLLTSTHKIIAEHIYQDVYNNNGILLNKKLLIRGSIKPDFMPNLKVQKHYMAESFDFTIDRIMKVINEPEIGLDKLSVNIGVISHYMADFFCLPHSKHWDLFNGKKILEHIKYEHILQERVSMHSGIFKPSFPKIEYECREDIKNYISEYYAEYKQIEGYRHDFENAVLINLSISSLIIGRLAKNQKCA